MNKKLLKLVLGASLFMGSSVAYAQKMDRHIVHGTPWVETRLPYAMTARELAQKYYGNVDEVNEIMKLNKSIRSMGTILYKDMMVHIPVTNSFTDQPERLGWVQ